MRNLLLPMLSFASLALVAHHGAGDAGPPLRLTLQLDGVDHAFVDGEEKTVTVAGKEVRAKASVHANRRFDAAGLQFEFPRGMIFGHEAGDYVSRWLLDGDDCSLKLHVHEGGGDAEELAASTLRVMLSSLDDDAEEPKPQAIVLGGKTLTGHRGLAVFNATKTSESRLTVTTVGLKVANKAIVLILTDSSEEGTCAETKQVLELLAKTFVVTDK